MNSIYNRTETVSYLGQNVYDKTQSEIEGKESLEPFNGLNVK